MRWLMAALAALLLVSGAAHAQAPQPVSIFSGKLNSLGHCQIVGLVTSTAIVTASCTTGAVPSSYSALDIIVENQSIRYWTDGTAPTASVGMLMAVGAEKIFVLTNFTNLHLIQTAPSATVDLEFFGP